MLLSKMNILLATVFVVVNDWRVNDLVFVRGLLKRFAVSHRSNWSLEKLEDHGILRDIANDVFFFSEQLQRSGVIELPLEERNQTMQIY